MDNRTIEEVRKNETKLIEEIKSLEKQLEYLRSGEYYNQLRFENEMLQQVVDTNGVPSEVYDYIDCTHRNTELLEENQLLKKKNQQLKDRDLIIAAELTKLQQENKILRENAENNDKVVNKVNWENMLLKKENEQLKDLIDTILNFSFFKEECPLNFEFENNTNEDKSQSIFYEDEWCENNCNDNYKDCWLKYFKKLQELESENRNE